MRTRTPRSRRNAAGRSELSPSASAPKVLKPEIDARTGLTSATSRKLGGDGGLQTSLEMEAG